MRRRIVSLAVLLLAAVVSVWGQSQPKTLARIYTIKVKAGEGQQWEAGLKRFHVWAHQHNLEGNTYTWSVITGSGEGEYIIGQFGHSWADFATMQKHSAEVGVGKELQETVAPYIESVVTSYYNFLPDLSITPPDPGKPPTPLSSVTVFTLKPGGVGPVVAAIKQADEAINKTHWGGHNNPGGWYVLVNGGEGPEIVLTNGMQDLAGMQPPATSFEAMLESVYGKVGAAALMHSFNRQVRSIRTELIAYRPDLSYIAQTH
jgi:hypothetical protein